MRKARATNLLCLYETLATSFIVGSTFVEVFVNPTFREVFRLGHVIRFIVVQPEKKVYVWDAYLTTHDRVADRLGIPWHDNEQVYFGMGRIRSSIIRITEFRFADIDNVQARLNRLALGRFNYVHWLAHQDFSWLHHYLFDVRSYPGLSHTE